MADEMMYKPLELHYEDYEDKIFASVLSNIKARLSSPSVWLPLNANRVDVEDDGNNYYDMFGRPLSNSNVKKLEGSPPGGGIEMGWIINYAVFGG
jgi:hypothetical protein